MPSQTAGTHCLAIHSPDVRSVMEFCLSEIADRRDSSNMPGTGKLIIFRSDRYIFTHRT